LGNPAEPALAPANAKDFDDSIAGLVAYWQSVNPE
jgi:hypothetical protein